MAQVTEGFLSWLDGKAFEASGEETALHNPGTGEQIGSTRLATPADIDRAVASARHAFTTVWAQTTPSDRGRLMWKMAAAIREHAEELAQVEMQNTGHPAAFARADAETAARYLEFYGGLADKIHGQTIPLGQDFVDYTVREPWGVCAVITPFNGPLQMPMRSVAPAIAAGNTVVLKPTDQAPAATLALVRVLGEAGLPAGVVNVLAGAADAGQRLVTHPDTRHVTFTGSVATGTAIMQSAAAQITPVTLELGGKSPQIVFADADLGTAVKAIVASALITAGQVCSAGTRLLVQESIRDEFNDRLVAAVNAIKIGLPTDGADMGPVVSRVQQRRIWDAISLGKQNTRLLVGGDEPVENAPAGGFFVRPTVFDGVDPGSPLAQEEIFGPVLGILPFQTDDDALSIANDSEFGLVSGVWTSNVQRAHTMARHLACAQVFINNYGSGGGIELPFGGYKKSGIGREKGVEALHEYTQVKNVCLRIG